MPAGFVEVRCACHDASVDLVLPADWRSLAESELLSRIGQQLVADAQGAASQPDAQRAGPAA